MRLNNDDAVVSFGTWIIQVMNGKVYIMGNKGQDIVIRGEEQLKDLVMALQWCVVNWKEEGKDG